MGRGEVHTGFWWVSLRKKYHLEYLGVDERINIKMYLHKVGWGGRHGLD